ncbi:MAG: 3-oxoadipate enol-lactonase [Acidimicrobiia bacterium]|nr:3-oxoadipate enol-lactonase [Acidimicrobiia bacterium]
MPRLCGNAHLRPTPRAGPRNRGLASRGVRLASRVHLRGGSRRGDRAVSGESHRQHHQDGGAGHGRGSEDLASRGPPSDRPGSHPIQQDGDVTGLAGRTGTIRWSDTGGDHRPTVILIHSLGTDRTLWAHQMAALSEIRRVLTIDLPGHGESSARPGLYTIEDLGMDILDVARECGVAQFDVCGISMGGFISLWLACHAPDAVSTLIAGNTATRLGSAELWSERIGTVETHGMKAIREAVVGRFFAPGFEDRSSGDFEAINRVFAATDPIGYVGCCAALRDADLTEDVTRIDCPTLIIAGEHDVAAPPEQSHHLNDQISDSRVVVVPGTGHLSNLEAPTLFNREVLAILDGGPPPI